MPTLVTCPRCAKPYRLVGEIPLTYACSKCGEEMDLWQHTAAAQPRDAGTATGGRTPRKPASTASLVFTAIGVAAGVALGIALSDDTDEDSSGSSATVSATDLLAVHRSHESPEATKSRLAMDQSMADLKRQAARLSITSPKSDDVVGDTIRVVGTLNSGSPEDRVLVNGVEVRTGPGPFETTVTLKPDQTTIDVSIHGPSNIFSTMISVKRAP